MPRRSVFSFSTFTVASLCSRGSALGVLVIPDLRARHVSLRNGQDPTEARAKKMSVEEESGRLHN